MCTFGRTRCLKEDLRWRDRYDGLRELGEERRMRLRRVWRSNHHREVIWTVERLGKRGRQRDSSRVRVDVQYGVMRMLIVLGLV